MLNNAWPSATRVLSTPSQPLVFVLGQLSHKCIFLHWFLSQECWITGVSVRRLLSGLAWTSALSKSSFSIITPISLIASLFKADRLDLTTMCQCLITTSKSLSPWNMHQKRLCPNAQEHFQRRFFRILLGWSWVVFLWAGLGSVAVNAQAQDQIQSSIKDQNQPQISNSMAFKEPIAFQFNKGAWSYACEGAQLLGPRPREESFRSASAEDQSNLIKALRSIEPSCLKAAPYYALLGNLHLLAHQPKEALEALERSLLLEPEQPGVQFDFALSLAEAGDAQSAKALIDQIMLRPDVPKALKESIDALRDTKGSKESGVKLNGVHALATLSEGKEAQGKALKDNDTKAFGAWGITGNVAMMAGRDSNLNSASFVNTVNLTLPNGVVALTLDPSSLPQSGPVHLASTQLIAQRALGDRTLVLSGSWMGRETPGNPGLGFNNEEFVAHLRPQGDLGWHQRVVVNHFELGSSNFYNGLSWSNWWQSDLSDRLKPYLGPKGACVSKVGADLERRTYAQDASQNGVYAGALVGGTCSLTQNQVNLTLQGGQDWASDHFRAGGNQRRLEVKLQWFYFQEKARFGLEMGQQWLRDSTTYSELLGGIDRITQRNSVRMSYQYQLIDKLSMMEGSLAWVTTLEKQSYRSTISLFNLRGESLQTGLKWEF
jgi:tetratricopeptide (TPR) repeat protein